MNTLLKGAVASSICSLLAISAAAQGGPPQLAKDLAPARYGTRLLVTSPAFSSGGTMDEKYTQDGANLSPTIEWTKGPTGTRSYAVLVADATVNRPEPIMHWIVYNIPAATRSLPSQTPGDSALPEGVAQAKNVSGAQGYIGPKPPAGETHSYHFQVFALNSTLNLDAASTDRMAVINAMKGRVLASGSVIGRYTGK
jgi:Raf kinase inhibitor-like YbhB/YbcL family protein